MTKNKFILSIYLIFLFFFLSSCREVVVEYDCGEVNTSIVSLAESVGSYDLEFNSTKSVNFETAAFRILVDDITLDTDESCFAFTSLPQTIETISITSSDLVQMGGIEFLAGDELNDLFELHNYSITYSIIDFITAHTTDPQLFNSEEDEIILQFLNKPDIDIDQNFTVHITFDDNEQLSVSIANFVVSN